MKIIFLFILYISVSTTVPAVAQNSDTQNKGNKSNTYISKGNSMKTDISVSGTENVSAKNKTNTNGTNSKNKGCVNCPGFEGIVLSTNTDAKYNFDSICKSLQGSIDALNIGGVWKYNNTILVNKEGHLIKKLRAYYNDLDQELYGKKQSSTNSGTADQSLSPGLVPIGDIMEDPSEKIKKENERLGRETYDPSNLLIVYDPNVDYLFFDKEGNENDNYVIRKQKPDRSIIQLTTADIRYKIIPDKKTNEYFFTLTNKDEKTTKEFNLIKLTSDSFIIADKFFKEVHTFSRTGIH